jgi:hypothetical protein
MKSKTIFFIFLFIASQLFYCEKKVITPDQPTVPEVTTTEATFITSTSAISGGCVVKSGDKAIIDRGICWSTVSNPTVLMGTKISDDGGTGIFIIPLVNLTSSTTYYIRAYAINSIGISYGSQVSFTTTSSGVTGTYYVSHTGSNINNGSINAPFATLSYACTKATKSGNIIHINPGTIAEKDQCRLAPGVSIEGDGPTSIIKSIMSGTGFTIHLESGSENTNGNQHISGIKMDGNNQTAYGAITIRFRGNVKIYNCTFVNFKMFGIKYYNGEPPDDRWATGCEFHNNIVTNCAGYFNEDSKGDALHITGTDGMLVYNNTMTENKSNGANGNCIGMVEGFNKNLKIYKNTIHHKYLHGWPSAGSTHWDFAIEMWNALGGVEIYNNDIIGSIDICRALGKGSSEYCVWIHNNNIGQTTLLAGENIRGILLEHITNDVIIEYNHIKNVAQGFMVNTEYPNVSTKNIRVSYNIFENIGANGLNSKGWGINWGCDVCDHILTGVIDNIQILNNVFTGSSSATTRWGIELPDSDHSTNVTIQNNIIYNFDYCSIYGNGEGGTTIDNLSIENNIFYGDANNDIIYLNGMSPTNNTTRNNYTDNPLFVSSTNFHLQPGSPAINNGIDVGLSKDYDGSNVNNPPEIGVYEYIP